MKKGTKNTLKFKRLKRRLGLPDWQVVGVLEAIWGICLDTTPDGAIGRMSNEDIAAEIEWAGSADELITVLVEEGWLDEDPEFRLIVHDWSQHAPSYLARAYKQHGKPFADQVALQRIGQPKPVQCSESGYRCTETVDQSGCTCAPKPILSYPIQSQEESGDPPSPAASADSAATPPRKRVSPNVPDGMVAGIDTAGMTVDPLWGREELADLFVELIELIRAAHPKARTIPPGGTGRWFEWRAVLAALVDRDGYGDADVGAALKWVFLSEHKDALFWRKQVQSLPALRKRESADSPSKFCRIWEAWKAAHSGNGRSGPHGPGGPDGRGGGPAVGTGPPDETVKCGDCGWVGGLRDCFWDAAGDEDEIKIYYCPRCRAELKRTGVG